MDLSPLERRMLANQYRMLRAVAPDEARYERYEELIDILEGGFEVEYGKILGRVIENRLSVEDCHLVGDALLMCSSLLDIKGQSNADVSEFEYVGFDGNNETDHLSYATFLYEGHPAGYPGIKGVGDSHHPTLARYRKMIEAWKQSEHPNRLTEGDVARILAAGANL